jgi:hypothetical protein
VKPSKDEKNHNFQIETRQKTDELFSTDTPLLSGNTEVLGVRLVLGYAIIAFFGISDAPFEVRIFEDCDEDGSFPAIATLVAALENGVYIVCERIAQCGVYMRADVVSTGANQSFLELCGRGMPLA